MRTGGFWGERNYLGEGDNSPEFIGRKLHSLILKRGQIRFIDNIKIKSYLYNSEQLISKKPELLKYSG